MSFDAPYQKGWGQSLWDAIALLNQSVDLYPYGLNRVRISN